MAHCFAAGRAGAATKRQCPTPLINAPRCHIGLALGGDDDAGICVVEPAGQQCAAPAHNHNVKSSLPNHRGTPAIDCACVRARTLGGHRYRHPYTHTRTRAHAHKHSHHTRACACMHTPVLCQAHERSIFFHQQDEQRIRCKVANLVCRGWEVRSWRTSEYACVCVWGGYGLGVL